ncbi:MAG: hypothetical protein JNK47_02755 [Mesorhizobium sp.]|nr:hypothetical protein [Mesorhizobium sp.]MBL8576121.1 hypothetical protein [Mesorhizobium sp.]
MEERGKRFRCLPEPSGKWMVWDDTRAAPAVLGGCVLSGREEYRARIACEILERIYRNRLDAPSVRKTAGGKQIESASVNQPNS